MMRSNSLLWKRLLCLLVFVITNDDFQFADSLERNINGLRGVSVSSTQALMADGKNERNSTLLVSNITSFPLHAHSGTHHIHVYVGSPPQRQTLIVDTGSRAMAFPCQPCQSCGNHASPYFDPSRSTTNRLSQCGNCHLTGISSCSLYGDLCEITQKYTEGSSWSAKEVEDMVWFGTSDVVQSVEEHMQLAIPYAFGCQTSIKGLFQKQYADGILGLGRHDTSVIAALYKAALIPRNAFSLCLTVKDGYMSLGGSLPTQHHLEPMKMTPISREHGWYSVEIVMLLVGDIQVTSVEKHPHLLESINSGKGCILDSGTTDTFLPEYLAKAVGEAVLIYTDGLTDFSRHSRVKSYSFDEFESLPDITFVMTNNVTLTMQPQYYMEGTPLDLKGSVQGWKGSKILTNRIYIEEPEGTVLGANAMFGHDILFDVQGHQIGIARADCAIPAISDSVS